MLPLRIEGATVAEVDGCYVSRWRLTSDELAALNHGGYIELWMRQPDADILLLARAPADDDENTTPV